MFRINKDLTIGELLDKAPELAGVLNGIGIDSNKGISKEKIIMTLLWSNATNDDYLNPCNYLRKRINY